MIDQPQSFVRDELFKLVFGCSDARHIARAGFGGNVVSPVPAQCVIVDVKLASGSVDRATGRQETLDPHPFGVITALATAGGRPPSSCDLMPHDQTYIIQINYSE